MRIATDPQNRAVTADGVADVRQEGRRLDRRWADEYDFVRFRVADMRGIARCKLIPRRHVADKLSTGITMCASMPVLHVCH